MGTFVPINELCKKDWPKHKTKEQWVATFKNLNPKGVTWKALWMN